jgi:cob(I)alamin adenosyltransferase
MIGLLILSVLLLLTLSASTYLLGYTLGGHGWRAKLDQARTESREAERQLHNLTRDAVIAMSEHVNRLRQNGR